MSDIFMYETPLPVNMIISNRDDLYQILDDYASHACDNPDTDYLPLLHNAFERSDNPAINNLAEGRTVESQTRDHILPLYRFLLPIKANRKQNNAVVESGLCELLSSAGALMTETHSPLLTDVAFDLIDRWLWNPVVCGAVGATLGYLTTVDVQDNSTLYGAVAGSIVGLVGSIMKYCVCRNLPLNQAKQLDSEIDITELHIIQNYETSSCDFF